MRLHRYLNEAMEDHLGYYNAIEKEQLKLGWERIQKDCKPFLKDLSKANDFIYRGMNRLGYFTKKKVRKDRNPLTTTIELHRMYDRYFQEKYGWKARSQGLFVTGSSNDASSYGPKTYMIFPIGNYGFLWSPEVADLFIFASQEGIRQADKRLPEEELYNKVKKVFDKAEYTDKNLAAAIADEGEIMIKTDTYYAMDVFFAPVMEELIFKGRKLEL